MNINNIENKWMYNLFSGDRWYSDEYDTKEEAIEAAKSEIEEDYKDEIFGFEVGQVKNIEISICASRILEDIVEDIYEEVGDLADDYLDNVTNEHEQILGDRLHEVITKWMDEFGYYPSFYAIKNIEQVSIEDDE